MKRSEFVSGSVVLLSLAGAANARTLAAVLTNPAGYPISAEIFTTRQHAVMPGLTPWGIDTIYPYEVTKYRAAGYGRWHYGDGLASAKRLDLMPAGYAGAQAAGGMDLNGPPAANSAKLLSFFTITDIHITDKESPAQAILLGYKGGLSSAYSPVMLYTTHVLDAAVQTINAIHKQDPFDFGISLGDASNNTQFNEVRWYVDVLDGKAIDPASGATGSTAQRVGYQQPYQAAGLDKTIPWYQALGNHDHFWMGSLPVDEYLRQTYLGDTILNLGNAFKYGTQSRGFYMGSIDGRTPYGDVIGGGLVKDFASPPRIRAADPQRRSLSRKEWMNEFFSTTSGPVGHGFGTSNVENDFASYSFEPKSGMPIKMIVLDDTQNENDRSAGGYGHGSLDKSRFDWLVTELDAGQTGGKLMIVAAHVPIGVEPAGSPVGWWSDAEVSEATLLAKLHEYPNLILWIAGHRHVNAITALKSPDPARPELGFWEVETSSLRDFPQQFRAFDIVRNSDDTISIFATDVDPAVKEGTPAAISRSYAVAAQQLFKNELVEPPTGSSNAELVEQLAPEMRAKMRNYGKPVRT